MGIFCAHALDYSIFYLLRVSDIISNGSNQYYTIHNLKFAFFMYIYDMYSSLEII